VNADAGEKPALSRLVIAIALIALSCFSHWDNAAFASEPPDDAELVQLREQDQEDRLARNSRPDSSAVRAARDEVRRKRVLEILSEGRIRTAGDYYRAALVMHHGDAVSDARTAAAFARTSLVLKDSPAARQLVAATWDRLMVRLNRPQWYGTQMRRGPGGYERYPMDPIGPPEEDRGLLPFGP
jgi:hypothetical protein